ncbi:MAG: FtsK/SpoIIIE domain-containing protein [Actinobacteria bacterium]|nr:FtsK/SpoIIIE domain-containing protein [Actinomycetota bacterium]
MNNNNTSPSSNSGYEFAQLLWQWRTELSIVSLIAIAYWGCARRVGYTVSAVIVALAVTALLCLPSVRRLLARTLRLAHWRRKFARALSLQSSPLATRQPRVIKVMRIPSGVRLTVSLQSGTAFHDLERLCPYLATHFRARDVWVTPDRADASRADLTICSNDPFEDGPIPWPGIQSKQVSAWDPIPVGVDRDGNEVKLSLIERNLLIGGEPGSGKSVMLNVLIAHLARCVDVELYLFDAKFVQSPPVPCSFGVRQRAVLDVRYNTSKSLPCDATEEAFVRGWDATLQRQLPAVYGSSDTSYIANLTGAPAPPFTWGTDYGNKPDPSDLSRIPSWDYINNQCTTQDSYTCSKAGIVLDYGDAPVY